MAESPTFRCSVERRGTHLSLELEGDFDLGAADILSTVSASMLADRSATAVDVDCSAITFADASAIRALISLNRGARAERKSLAIHSAPACMQRILRLVDVDLPIIAARP